MLTDRLAKALEKDPTNPRNLFYYAQSLRDAGDYPASLSAYERRGTMMGAWDEETYFALLQCARLKAALSLRAALPDYSRSQLERAKALDIHTLYHGLGDLHGVDVARLTESLRRDPKRGHRKTDPRGRDAEATRGRCHAAMTLALLRAGRRTATFFRESHLDLLTPPGFDPMLKDESGRRRWKRPGPGTEPLGGPAHESA